MKSQLVTVPNPRRRLLKAGLDSLPRMFKTTLLVGVLTLSTPAHAGLIGFYPFDGPDPQNDSSPSAAHLTSAGADPSHLPAGGLEGGAYSFNGSQRWVAPIDIDPFTRPQLTMGAWVKTSNLNPGLRKIIGSDDGGWDRTLGLDDRDGPFRYTTFIGNGSPAAGAPGPKSTNQWTFIAVTYDEPSLTLSFYVDLDAVSAEPLSAVTLPTGFGSGFTTIAIGSLRPDNADEGWR
jgi:hypothetical protein